MTNFAIHNNPLYICTAKARLAFTPMPQDMNIETICKWNDSSIVWAYDHFYQSLVVTSLQIVADQETAEDIVQYFFTRLIELKPDFENLAHVKAYFYNGVRNASVSWLRHKRVINDHVEKLVHDQQYYLNYNGEEGFYAEEICRRLFMTIDTLPPHQREIFLLSMQGKSNGETATQLNIAIDTVKTRKKRGKQRLSKLLAPEVFLLLLLMNIEA